MRTKIWQVDAFTDQLFAGNPAAVIVVDDWWSDETLQAIAAENNVSETAFLKRTGEGAFHLRWFTPATEVPLCGHATLASAHVLWTELDEPSERLTFSTLSGDLDVVRSGDQYAMEFPADPPSPIDMPQGLIAALGAGPASVHGGQYILAVMRDAETVKNLTPDFGALASIKQARERGAAEDCVVVTAPGTDGVDFVSRFFGPTVGVDEDPVTGSAHCMLASYWAARLGKQTLVARQLSVRGGDVLCTVRGDRVELVGDAVTYLRGEVDLPV